MNLKHWLNLWIRIRKISSFFFFFLKEKKKTYVKTSKYGIIKNLYSFGLIGGLPVFVEIFLIINERFYFNIRVGCTVSDSHQQKMAVLQGSLMCVILIASQNQQHQPVFET